MRARVVVAAAVAIAASWAGPVAAQNAVQPPPMKQVLAGRKFVPPIRGEALVEFTAPQTRRVKDMVVTRITVRNASVSPVARLTIDETWYDKTTAVLTGGKGIIPGLLQPGEVQVITIETPFKPGMTSNNFTFSHANGTVKPQRVDKLEAPPPATASAATPAAAPAR
jgi:hypothetical protein